MSWITQRNCSYAKPTFLKSDGVKVKGVYFPVKSLLGYFSTDDKETYVS